MTVHLEATRGAVRGRDVQSGDAGRGGAKWSVARSGEVSGKGGEGQR